MDFKGPHEPRIAKERPRHVSAKLEAPEMTVEGPQKSKLAADKGGQFSNRQFNGFEIRFNYFFFLVSVFVSGLGASSATGSSLPLFLLRVVTTVSVKS